MAFRTINPKDTKSATGALKEIQAEIGGLAGMWDRRVQGNVTDRQTAAVRDAYFDCLEIVDAYMKEAGIPPFETQRGAR